MTAEVFSPYQRPPVSKDPPSPDNDVSVSLTALVAKAEGMGLPPKTIEQILGVAHYKGEDFSIAAEDGADHLLIVPGNGAEVEENWYLNVAGVAVNRGLGATVLDMSGLPYVANVWERAIHHAINKNGGPEKTILMGHSSGAMAAMNVAELRSPKGLVLVAPHATGLGIDAEYQSGLFDRSPNYKAIRQRVGNLVVVCSDNDPYIPPDETEAIASGLNVKPWVIPNSGHFTSIYLPNFPEVLDSILANPEKS